MICATASLPIRLPIAQVSLRQNGATKSWSNFQAESWCGWIFKAFHCLCLLVIHLLLPTIHHTVFQVLLLRTPLQCFSLFYATMPMHNSREQFMFSFTYVVVITSLYQSATSKQTVKEDTAWSKGMNGAKHGYISASLVDWILLVFNVLIGVIYAMRWDYYKRDIHAALTLERPDTSNHICQQPQLSKANDKDPRSYQGSCICWAILRIRDRLLTTGQYPLLPNVWFRNRGTLHLLFSNEKLPELLVWV